MGDAVCGPSNPLQQFKHQTQVDRTIQQDRLALRHSASQGFRSAGPSSHHLDAEYEAFQAGAPLAELPHFHPQHDLTRQAQFASPQVPSWASDFQQLSISPMPMQAQPMQQPISPMAAGGGDWASDFRQHIAQPAARAQSYSPSPLAFQQRARYGMGSTFDSFSQPVMAERPQSKGKMAVREEFDDAAFARAFDMVAQENFEHEEAMQSVEQEPVQEADVFDTAETMEETIEKALKDSIFDPETVLGHVHIDEPASYAASDMDYNGAGLTENARQEPEQQQEQQASTIISADDDALAMTAGELLERVVDNQSDKFQNSQFLTLMRKLRDREVKVDGDKMVETVDTLEPSSQAPNFESHIPFHQQDTDPYRGGVDPNSDGSDVVNLLASQMAGGNDIERQRLSNLWRSQMPQQSSSSLPPLRETRIE